MKRLIGFVLAAVCAFALSACHTNSSAAPSASSATAPTFVSWSISPSPLPTLKVGATLQVHAIATYSDKSNADVTEATTWASSAPPFATVTAGGLVKALQAATLQINGTYNSVPLGSSLVITN
jgi:hypothetical protein